MMNKKQVTFIVTCYALLGLLLLLGAGLLGTASAGTTATPSSDREMVQAMHQQNKELANIGAQLQRITIILEVIAKERAPHTR